MTELPDVVGAFLTVAVGSVPFSTEPFYSAVSFVSGYPKGDAALPAVAIYWIGGSNSAKGLGTVQQYRRPTLRVDVLTENRLENQRIVEKLRDVWQADFNITDPTLYGTIGNGYLRDTGGVKYVEFGEASQTPWDELHYRQTFDIVARVSD